jgi:outer membrane murein-binding lipoprotein Lpp
LNARMDTIISCMDVSKIAKLEEDMNTLNAKIDTIISCIDLSK